MILFSKIHSFYLFHAQLIERILFLIAILSAVLIRYSFLNRGFFYDELFLVTHFLQSPELFGPSFKDYTTANHMGYTICSYVTSHLFGMKEWAVRLPALCFDIASMCVFGYWTRKYFGRAVASVGMILFVFSPASIIWSSSARGYSAMIFFTLASSILYFRLLQQTSKRTLFLFIVTNLIGFSFHLYFAFIEIVQLFHLVLLAFASSRLNISRKNLVNLSIGMGITCILSVLIYAPIMFKFLMQQTGVHGELIPYFPLKVFTDLISVSWLPLGLICLIVMIVGFKYFNPRLVYWPVYVLLLFLIPLPIWLSKPWFLYPRFFSFLLPFIFLGLANGMVMIPRLFPKPFQIILGLCMVAVLCAILWSWKNNSANVVQEFNSTFKESVAFAEGISNSQVRFCSFGSEDQFFQYYSKRPVIQFKTFEEFLLFYNQKIDSLCFAIMGPPMNDEHKKIFLFMLTHSQFKSFDKINVFHIGERL